MYAEPDQLVEFKAILPYTIFLKSLICRLQAMTNKITKMLKVN